jgi:hypothetical protein
MIKNPKEIDIIAFGRKRHVTLLEVVIAMSLTAVILMSLSFFYREVSYVGEELDKIRAQNFFLRYVESRLISVLPKAIQKGTEFCFFSIENDTVSAPGCQSLILTYNNDICLDNPFSNTVVGRLFVDAKERLTFVYWPSPKLWENLDVVIPMKKEILLEGVNSLSFEFYVAPSKKENSQESENEKQPKPSTPTDQKKGPEPKGAWRRDLWSSEFQELPALIRVKVGTKEMGTMVFAFPLPSRNVRIVYDLD